MSELLADLRKTLLGLWTQAEARFGSDLVVNDRLRALIAAVGAIVLLSALLALNSVASTAERQYRTTQTAYTRLKAQVETGSWSERRAESQSLKTNLEERFWYAETPGLAEAGYERWLREHMSPYKLDAQQIQVRRVPALTGGQDTSKSTPVADTERMTAKILLPFDQNGLLGFLADLAESEKLVAIDRLIIRSGRNARVEIDVSTFFRSHQAPAGPGAAP